MTKRAPNIDPIAFAALAEAGCAPLATYVATNPKNLRTRAYEATGASVPNALAAARLGAYYLPVTPEWPDAAPVFSLRSV